MATLAWLLGACCLQWVLASGGRDGKKSQQVAVRQETTREVEPRRCGVAPIGECGRVGDRDPWTRVGTRRLAAQERERISEGIEGLGFGGIYVFSGVGPNIGCWASFDIYHMHSTGRQGHNVDPDGIEFGDRGTFPSALPSMGDENWPLVSPWRVKTYHPHSLMDEIPFEDRVPVAIPRCGRRKVG
jgi:hypothetical protein